MFFSINLALSELLPIVVIRGRRLVSPRQTKSLLDPEQVKKILVIRLDSIGDVVMSTPMFRELKQRYPYASVTAVVRCPHRELLETNPFVDRVVGVATGFTSGRSRLKSVLRTYWHSLRQDSFDVVLHPRVGKDMLFESLLVALVDAPVSIGYQTREKYSYGFDRTQVLTKALAAPGPENEVLTNAAVVTALSGAAFSPRTEIFPSRADCDFAGSKIAGYSTGTLIIGLGFGAAHMARHWRPSLWGKTLNLLAEHHRIAVWIFSSPKDTAEAEEIRRSIAASIPLQVVEGASLRQIAACLGMSSLFLGTDSGLAHIAAAMGTPLVVVSPHPQDGDLMHENSPKRFAPFHPMARIVSPATALAPCSRACSMPVPHCILQVTPYDVLREVGHLLKSS